MHSSPSFHRGEEWRGRGREEERGKEWPPLVSTGGMSGGEREGGGKGKGMASPSFQREEWRGRGREEERGKERRGRLGDGSHIQLRNLPCLLTVVTSLANRQWPYPSINQEIFIMSCNFLFHSKNGIQTLVH